MVRANETVQHIFSELYTVQEHIKPSYIRIKLLELLLILTEMDFDRIKNDYVYFSNRKGTVPDRFMIYCRTYQRTLYN